MCIGLRCRQEYECVHIAIGCWKGVEEQTCLGKKALHNVLISTLSDTDKVEAKGVSYFLSFFPVFLFSFLPFF